MAYDRVVTELNACRLRGTSYPVTHGLLEASLTVSSSIQSSSSQPQVLFAPTLHILSKITAEPPALPPLEHASAHILNTPLFERKYARVYLGDPESREAVDLRRQIAKGAREALEEQYWDVVERTLQARAIEARLGGDPSLANKIRAYVLVRHYRQGEWEDRIEVCPIIRSNINIFHIKTPCQLVAGQPVWAKLFYLVRTGHAKEALDEAIKNQQAIEHREASFISHFRAWVESPDRRFVPLHFST